MTDNFGRCLRALVLVSFLLTTAFLPLRQEAANVHITQVDASDFPRVTVYVSVTDENGDPVAVDPAQIAVAENGEKVRHEAVHGLGEGEPLATLLAIDVSGSMNKADKLTAAKRAAAAYVEQMNSDDLVGLLTFNTAWELVQPLTSDRQLLLGAIDGITAEHDTAMYDALYEAVGILSARAGRKAIIVLTDGLDNRSLHHSSDVISLIGPAGMSISTVGLGDPTQAGISQSGLDVGALRSLAERAGGTYAYAADQAALTAIYERYSRALHSEYAVTYTTGARLRDGVNRSLSVALSEAADVPGATAEYNPGGLVPEVAQANTWPLFFGLMVGLILLFAAPGAIARLVRPRESRSAASPRIKLADTSKPRVRLR
jgi:Ca-activated chloride channel family protein